MDKEQAVFEQLTLSDFKNWSSSTLKTFNNYTIIMTNNSDKIRISCVVFLSLLLIFEFTQQAALVNFMFYLDIFKILKILFRTFRRKNLLPRKLKIAQCKQPQLVKPSLIKLHIQILWNSFTTDNRFLLTPSQSLPWKQENLPPAPLDTSTTALVCIFSSILN